MNREKLESYLEKNPFAKLSDVVTQILYDEIVVLDIPPTSKLNINQIATDLGISRTPVVEAINRLQAIGFVETRPKASGFYVTDMNLLDMIDLYDARTAIECEAAALCADKASPEAIAQLDSLATEFKKAVPRMDGKKLFHNVIRECCAVANAKGVKMDADEFIRVDHQHIIDNISDYYPSMAQDMLYKKLRTEVDTLTGAISDYGKQFNIPTPTCDVLSDIVRCIQDNYDNQYGEKNGAVNG